MEPIPAGVKIPSALSAGITVLCGAGVAEGWPVCAPVAVAPTVPATLPEDGFESGFAANPGLTLALVLVAGRTVVLAVPDAVPGTVAALAGLVVFAAADSGDATGPAVAAFVVGAAVASANFCGNRLVGATTRSASAVLAPVAFAFPLAEFETTGALASEEVSRWSPGGASPGVKVSAAGACPGVYRSG